MRFKMSKNYTHPKVEREDTERIVEYTVDHEGREVLVISSQGSVVVPGYFIRKSYQETPQGLKISEIDPIPEDKKPCIDNLVKKHFEELSQRVYGNPHTIKIKSINYW